MASHGEKAQKLSGEAFSRIRGDHELFLEAYESKTASDSACFPGEVLFLALSSPGLITW